MAVKTIRLAGADIELHENGLTVTRLPEGEVHAVAQDTDEYRRRSAELGYGSNIGRMSREHEIGHALAAHWLNLPCSPTMLGLAVGKHADCWRDEEALVLSLQRLSRRLGIDLQAVAERLAEETT